MELYLHIPFCRQKCAYCDFASWAGREAWIPAYVTAVLREAEQARMALGPQGLITAFIGGGTPSLLPVDALRRLLRGVQALFPLEAGAEFTSEANPGTLTPQWLDAALSLGVNRLSLGMQAAQEPILRALGRIHTMAQVRESVAMARRAGMQNLSLDLMFGLPGQTLADWSESIDAALALEPEHLSCYGLIPEEGTPLGDAIARGEVELPPEETERAMYDLALERLRRAGFLQYEISNFARPGYACAHNLGYWRQTPYLGLGVAAASMLPGTDPEEAYRRRTNVRDLAAYLRQGQAGRFIPAEEERITPAQARFESMMLGLRTCEGVSERAFLTMHGIPLEEVYGQRLRALAQRGLTEKAGEWWRLTRRGMDVQNAVLVELMEE